MPSHYQPSLGTRLADRVKWLAGPVHRRWRRWRSYARPLPKNWWPDFERDFNAYCAMSRGRPRRTDPDL